MSGMYQNFYLKKKKPEQHSRHHLEINADTEWVPEGTLRSLFSPCSLHKDNSPILSDCDFLHWTKDEVEQMAFKVALMFKSQ